MSQDEGELFRELENKMAGLQLADGKQVAEAQKWASSLTLAQKELIRQRLSASSNQTKVQLIMLKILQGVPAQNTSDTDRVSALIGAMLG